MEAKKRKRDRPIKKWSEEENMAILDYIYENGNFEKPTAKLYYLKLLNDIKIDSTWDLVKYKMRYYRRLYEKANQWMKSGKADPTGDNSEIKAIVHKICPHYKLLSEIFEKKSQNDSVVMSNSELEYEDPLESEIEVTIKDEYAEISTPLSSPHLDQEQAQYDSIVSPDGTPVPTNWSAELPGTSGEVNAHNSSADLAMRKEPKSALNKLAALEAERISITSKKLEQENKHFEQNLELQKEKFKFEKEIQREHLRLEEQKIKHEFELKKLELEQKERLAMKELDLKYKYLK
ncbi:uncharacterized protein LOC119678949 [Teleopsis dalmanni]|uniref:uncharacterized protein LOC119678949 n=1 Tax=Teleopsis dalmanni TaxID=139649 RepID=UPI0018CE1E31|nr:uncharacterized protein LOC119678949 [Teleopsis dalmanni]